MAPSTRPTVTRTVDDLIIPRLVNTAVCVNDAGGFFIWEMGMAEGSDEPKRGRTKKEPLATIDKMMDAYHDQMDKIRTDNRGLIRDVVDKHSLIERADDSVDTAVTTEREEGTQEGRRCVLS